MNRYLTQVGKAIHILSFAEDEHYTCHVIREIENASTPEEKEGFEEELHNLEYGQWVAWNVSYVVYVDNECIEKDSITTILEYGEANIHEMMKVAVEHFGNIVVQNCEQKWFTV